jgi:hypothetical protein
MSVVLPSIEREQYMFQSILTIGLLALFVTFTPLTSAQDDDPPPPKKKQDSDPPLPSKKRIVTRVKVTAESAEILSGDDVIAECKQGSLLEYIKKNEEHFLVVVNGKKGWIKQTDAKLVTVEENNAEGSNAKVPEPGKQTSPDGSIEITVKNGRIGGYNKESDARWLLPDDDKDPYRILTVKFAPKGLRVVKSFGPCLYIVTDRQLICAEATKGKLLWSHPLVQTAGNIETVDLSFEDDALVIRYNKIIHKFKTSDGAEISRTGVDD